MKQYTFKEDYEAFGEVINEGILPSTPPRKTFFKGEIIYGDLIVDKVKIESTNSRFYIPITEFEKINYKPGSLGKFIQMNKQLLIIILVIVIIIIILKLAKVF